MSKNLQCVRGMRDILGLEVEIKESVLHILSKIAALYSYEEIEVPIIEKAELYNKTLGESSDIVNKEMYIFQDRDGRSLTLRPEFTAGVVRAALCLKERDVHSQRKFFSHGSLFRYERPQKGRYRQFCQFNCEFINARSYYADVEVILMVIDMLRDLHLQEFVTLEINSLGSEEDRMKYRSALVSYFEDYANQLSQESLKRIKQNPLRILDTKDSQEKELIRKAPKIYDYLSNQSREYFLAVTEFLKQKKIKYVHNHLLVRGMDYYNDIVFECKTEEGLLGAQNTIIAGGRYDALFQQMGSKDCVPAIGFACGVDRVVELLKMLKDQYYIISQQYKKNSGLMIIPISSSQGQDAVDLASLMRKEGIKADIEYGVTVKKAMNKANQNRCTFVIFLGEEELKNASCKVRNMKNGEEEIVALSNIVSYIREREGLF